jgi:hypothetical protein
MSALFFLLLAVVVAGVGCSLTYPRQRTPASLDPGIDSFRREMQALSGARSRLDEPAHHGASDREE